MTEPPVELLDESLSVAGRGAEKFLKLDGKYIPCPNHYKDCSGSLKITEQHDWVTVYTCSVCGWAETEYPDEAESV